MLSVAMKACGGISEKITREFIFVAITVHLHCDGIGCVDDINELRMCLSSVGAVDIFMDVAVLVEKRTIGAVDSDASVPGGPVARLEAEDGLLHG